MTKKHFEFVADLLSEVKDIENRKLLAFAAINQFENENPLFKRDIFLKRCEVDFKT